MIENRAARRDDIPSIASFQIAMAEETEGLALDGETVGLGVQAVFDDAGKGSYWVAEEEGKVQACLLTLPEWSDWRNGTVLWIHSVYVIPEARGRGIFRGMYEKLVEKVKADPTLRGLRLYVDRNNERAMEVYESVGMNGEHYRLYEWMKDF